MKCYAPHEKVDLLLATLDQAKSKYEVNLLRGDLEREQTERKMLEDKLP